MRRVESQNHLSYSGVAALVYELIIMARTAESMIFFIVVNAFEVCVVIFYYILLHSIVFYFKESSIRPAIIYGRCQSS